MLKNVERKQSREGKFPENLKWVCAEEGVSCSSDVGLNAQWNCSVYQVEPGIPNRTSGAYYVVDDLVNDKPVLYKRRYMDDPDYDGDGYNDELIELAEEQGRGEQAVVKIVAYLELSMRGD